MEESLTHTITLYYIILHYIILYWIHPPLAQNYALHDLDYMIHMITCIFAPGSLGQEVFKNPALGQLAFSALKTCCFSCSGIINRPQDLQVSQDSMPDSLRSPLKVPKRIQWEHDKARWKFETRHFVGCYAMLLSNHSVMLNHAHKSKRRRTACSSNPRSNYVTIPSWSFLPCILVLCMLQWHLVLCMLQWHAMTSLDGWWCHSYQLALPPKKKRWSYMAQRQWDSR